jgi:predicted nucleic acid-binding protein
MGAMSLLDSLPEGCPVGVDTAPFIYFIEGHDVYGPLIRPFFAQRVKPGLNQIITSVVTLSEMLVQPLRDERTDAIERYRRLLTHGRNVKLVAIDASVAEKASNLRAMHGIRLPDAFQIAAALQHGARYFLTPTTCG